LKNYNRLSPQVLIALFVIYLNSLPLNNKYQPTLISQGNEVKQFLHEECTKIQRNIYTTTIITVGREQLHIKGKPF